MRTPALAGALLVALASVPLPTAAQSLTQVDLSYGLFDGVGIGMADQARAAEYAPVGLAPASGSRVVYSDIAYGRGRGYGSGKGYYASRYDHSDWCWDQAWDLRWGRGYYGWHSRYDHLDFYHDCRSGGIGYAYDRWRWHARRAYQPRYGWHDGWYDGWTVGFSAHRGRGVYVSVYVTDPFWRPWGPYWSYDPWGWYWDGYRDGWYEGRWGSRGVVYAGARGRGVRGVYAGRPSPLAVPRFKEDPRVVASGDGARRAQPRVQPAAVPLAPARGVGRPSDARGTETNRPTPVAPPRRGAQPALAGRPSDRIRGAAQPQGSERPAARPERDATRARPSSPAAVSPRARPSDPAIRGADGEGARPRPSTPAVRTPERGERAAPSAAPRAGSDRPDAPSDRAAVRPPGREPSRAPVQPEASSPRAEPRPSPTARRPSAASTPSARRPSGGDAPAPRTRSGETSRRPSGGESTSSAPATRSGGGGERPAPAPRRPATR